MHLLSEGQIKCFCFRLDTHSVSLTCCINTTAVTETKPSFFAWTFGRHYFPHRDVDMWGRVWMSRFRGAWQNLVSSKPVWMSLFCWTQRKIFWRMWETEQFWGTIDFHSIFFPTMEVNGAPKQPGYKLSSKYLPLCLAEQRNSYRFGTTWGWVNDDRIFIFGWTIPLTLIKISFWFWDFSLCNFRDLTYALSACNTPKRKQNLKSHHMTPLSVQILIQPINLISFQLSRIEKKKKKNFFETKKFVSSFVPNELPCCLLHIDSSLTGI